MQKRRIMAKKVNEESGGKLRKLREERLAVEKLAKTRFKGTFLSAKKKNALCSLSAHHGKAERDVWRSAAMIGRCSLYSAQWLSINADHINE